MMAPITIPARAPPTWSAWSIAIVPGSGRVGTKAGNAVAIGQARIQSRRPPDGTRTVTTSRAALRASVAPEAPAAT